MQRNCTNLYKFYKYIFERFLTKICEISLPSKASVKPNDDFAKQTKKKKRQPSLC